MSKYLSFYLEVVLILVLPILLFTYSSDIFSFRPFIMGLGGIYCAYRLLKSEATLASLGIHRAKFVKATQDLFLPSLLLILFTLLVFSFTPLHYLKILVGYDPLTVSSFVERILAYMFLSAPVQELIFRGYITWRIKQVYSNTKIVEILSVAMFMFAHLPFYSPLLLLNTFFMGWIYIRNYQKYQNLFAPILSHAIVGASILTIYNTWFPYP